MNEKTLAAITKYFPAAVILALCYYILRLEGKNDALQEEYSKFRDAVYQDVKADNRVWQSLVERRNTGIRDTIYISEKAK